MTIFAEYFQQIVYTVGCVLLVPVFVPYVLRRYGKTATLIGMFLGTAAVIIIGWLVINWSALTERTQIEAMVEGYGPTYAQEMSLMGHEHLTEKTSPQDPSYLKMIEAQIRWEKVNPAIADIYTFRKRDNGQIYLMVDSETDYDRNGIYEGQKELRTPIGESYPLKFPELESAFSGVTSFRRDVYSDRWGTWVSAFFPMFDSRGKVEAVLGVDFPAKKWLAEINQARWISVLYLWIGVILIGTLYAQSCLRMSEVSAAKKMRALKNKFERLVNSIEGIVWEWDLAGNRCLFISSQAELMLGYPLERWTTNTQGLLRELIHPEDYINFNERHTNHSNDETTSRTEFRVIDYSGRTLWLRESATPCLSDDGKQVSRSIVKDITAEKQAAADLDDAHQRILETSRQAGMAEVATGVLHNVGNVLNSVNISSNLINEQIENSKVPSLRRVADLIKDNQENIGEFLGSDERGKKVPGFLSQLADHLADENKVISEEAILLGQKIEHIKEIVAMQQSYASVSREIEPLIPNSILEDAVLLNLAMLKRESVQLIRDGDEEPIILADSNRTLQILVNLIRNACQSLMQIHHGNRILKLSITSDAGKAFITVSDNGVGISEENMAKIFTYGFTTKTGGHGFGLHSAMFAAREMNCSITVKSDGPNQGATFILELPLATATPKQPKIRLNKTQPILTHEIL